ncbi:hypothetical protein ACFLTE_04150 [Bacteroidota bacterium]
MKQKINIILILILLSINLTVALGFEFSSKRDSIIYLSNNLNEEYLIFTDRNLYAVGEKIYLPRKNLAGFLGSCLNITNIVWF